MTRMTREEREDLLSSGPRLTRSLSERTGKKNPFLKNDGTTDLQALTRFQTRINALLGHPRRPFRPILGDRFLL